MKAIDIKKTVAVLSYLSKHINDLTQLKLHKLLYFIDKEYFNRYGMLVSGQKFIHLKHGPVCTQIREILNSDCNALSAEDREYFLSHLSISSNKKKKLGMLSEPEMDFLADAEIEVMDFVIQKYGELNAFELAEISHHENAWKITGSNQTIKPESMIEQGRWSEDHVNMILERYREDLELDNHLASL